MPSNHACASSRIRWRWRSWWPATVQPSTAARPTLRPALWREDGVFDVASYFELVGHEGIAGMVNGEGHQSLIHHGCGHVLTAPKSSSTATTRAGWNYAFNVRWDSEADRFWIARLVGERVDVSPRPGRLAGRAPYQRQPRRQRAPAQPVRHSCRAAEQLLVPGVELEVQRGQPAQDERRNVLVAPRVRRPVMLLAKCGSRPSRSSSRCDADPAPPPGRADRRDTSATPRPNARCWRDVQPVDAGTRPDPRSVRRRGWRRRSAASPSCRPGCRHRRPSWRPAPAGSSPFTGLS